MADEIIQPGKVPPELFATFAATTEDLAIFALDPEGRIASWSRGAERIKGYTAEEIIGKHLSTFYPEADKRNQKPRYVLRRATEEGRFEEEGWRIRKDGTMFWASAVLTAIRTSDGRLRGFVKVTRDLTARRHADEALRQSEDRYRLLIESVKDYAIFILDPAGHVMSWNPGARRLKGYEIEEILGRHFRIFYTPPDVERKHPEEELARAVREGHYEEEGWRVRKDGTRFWANVTLTPLYDSERRHIGFAKVTRDLTERKRAEEQLRDRAEMYAVLNRELDAFSHSVAHDLRAPARAVHHLVTILRRDAADRLEPGDRQTLDAIHGSAERMVSIIQDLLDLSLTARRDLDRARVNITRLARHSLEDVKRARPTPRLEAHVEEGLVAIGDESLLRLALTNLIDNAAKYSRDSATPRIEVGRAQTPRGLALYVRDNGIGFDAKHAPQLFHPFVRLHDATTFEGTGVGLSIVERIVRRHGGEVWADSAPGEGATFYFTLPERPFDGDERTQAS